MSTMKEAIVSKGTTVNIQDSPVPKAGKDQLVIKINVSGSNPKDWKYPDMTGQPANMGDDIAGTVHEVGPGAESYGFKVGDKVAAFHEMRTPGGSYAEYGVAWAYTTFSLPEATSFEEGASLPLAFLTAAVGLFDRLALPEPWSPAKQDIPLLVYGGATAVGAYAIKYAQQANIHPIITVAGRGIDFVETLIDRSKGDVIVDYRKGDESVRKDIKQALGNHKLYHVFDTVAEKGSQLNAASALEPNGKMTFVLPFDKVEGLPDNVTKSMTMVGDVHGSLKDLGYVHCKYMTRALHEGTYRGHPTQTVPGGLGGVQEALQNLKNGKASAVKYVFKIADTPGV